MSHSMPPGGEYNDPAKINADLHREKLFNLSGKTALVTGGGSGIGLMITQALAVNGAKVYIVGRTQEKLDRVVEQYSKNISGQIIPLAFDVTQKDQISALVKEFKSREQNLSILVNNAGINTTTFQTEASSAEEMSKNLFESPEATFEDWESVYRTNVTQVYFLTTAFLPLLQKASEAQQGYSSAVVNIASISGIVNVSQHHPAYNASKAATIHLSRMLSKDIVENGIRVRVNAISPGVFPSEMTTEGSDDKQKSEIARQKYESKVPAARPGKEDDIASAILFTIVNQYLNGQNIVVDGGYTLRF